jgi:hypothetical protein
MEEREELVITDINELKQFLYKNSDGSTIISIVITDENGGGGDT